MKQKLLNTLKNLYGWKTKRKLVVFSIDDYGNVRLDSKNARENLEKAGLKIANRFDAFDTLETTQDLLALYEVLDSVKDSHGNAAVFTPFAMPCNIDFESIEKNQYSAYEYENLDETFKKMQSRYPQAYTGARDLWKEGIEKGLMKPQFHGREHLNLKVFREKLKAKDPDVLTVLKNRSYTSISNSGYSTISPMAAFEFWEFAENEDFEEIIQTGLDAFEEVFGYRSTHFNPPGGREHPIIHEYLKNNGILYMDAPLIKKEHQGKGKYKNVFNYTGKRNKLNQIIQVRNVVFEPTSDKRDWVNYSFEQIKTAFRLNRPAIISSHRVNFCGFIDEKNREKGLQDLKKLLEKIVSAYPDVEFISSDTLGKEMAKTLFKS